VQVVEYAVVPDSKAGAPRTLLTLLAVFLGGFIGAVRVFFRHTLRTTGLRIAEDVTRDYANYFYPYISDQLTPPLAKFVKLCSAYGKTRCFIYIAWLAIS